MASRSGGFDKIMDHFIDSDANLSKMKEYFTKSDKLLSRMESLIEETGVGKSNQSNREKWLKERLCQIPGGRRILDAGAGELQYKRHCTHLTYVSQDFAKYDGAGDGSALQMGKWDQSNLDIISDITSIPESDSSFDAIMCIEVLEHLPNPILAIREFARLLKIGGELIITAPFCSLTHFAPYHFFTGFNRYFFETHLTAYGFEIEEITPSGNFFEFLAQEIRRMPDIGERYANDKPTRVELLSSRIVLNMLNRFSSNDTRSYDLLNYEYFVKAKKVKQVYL